LISFGAQADQTGRRRLRKNRFDFQTSPNTKAILSGGAGPSLSLGGAAMLRHSVSADFLKWAPRIRSKGAWDAGDR